MTRISDRAQLAAFTAIVLAGSAACAFAMPKDDPHGTLATVIMMLTMWLPALAGFLVALVATRSLRGFGWGIGTPGTWAAAYGAPLVYGGGAFAIAALLGVGHFDFANWRTGAGQWGMAPTAFNGLLIQMTVMIIPGFVMGLGEELGWRGFMVPRLARTHGFWGAVNIGALIWFAYHLPGLLSGSYGPVELPAAWKLAAFAALIWSASLFYAWLRLRSNSVWPAALSHAAHNTFIQMMFASGFSWTPDTHWIAGEFGIATIALMMLVAVMAARRGTAKPDETLVGQPALAR